MPIQISSIEEAFEALRDPSNPGCAVAFAFLSSHPETAPLMIETFRETLGQMGVAPSAIDRLTGEPTYGLAEDARALGLPEADLGDAVAAVEPSEGPGLS